MKKSAKKNVVAGILVLAAVLVCHPIHGFSEEMPETESLDKSVKEAVKEGAQIVEKKTEVTPLLDAEQSLKKFKRAKAILSSTRDDHDIRGEVVLIQMPDRLQIVVNVSGDITMGNHGIHIHENGSCDDAGSAAGGHYNPHATKHGFLPEEGMEHAHVGDMGNIQVNDLGKGLLKVDLPNVSLTKENPVLGKAVILHEKEDDFGQPTGNAGGRIACGIIEME
ncbi:MAG: superoxide dismutase family protein [Candidatus Omnitrophica bacterium]|nr:superoxide dismutase family protein [Candidatus Omnitrophota bacterium]